MYMHLWLHWIMTFIQMLNAMISTLTSVAVFKTKTCFKELLWITQHMFLSYLLQHSNRAYHIGLCKYMHTFVYKYENIHMHTCTTHTYVHM